MSSQNPKFLWGRPNPHYTPPTPADSSHTPSGTVDSASRDFSDVSHNTQEGIPVADVKSSLDDAFRHFEDNADIRFVDAQSNEEMTLESYKEYLDSLDDDAVEEFHDDVVIVDFSSNNHYEDLANQDFIDNLIEGYGDSSPYIKAGDEDYDNIRDKMDDVSIAIRVSELVRNDKYSEEIHHMLEENRDYNAIDSSLVQQLVSDDAYSLADDSQFIVEGIAEEFTDELIDDLASDGELHPDVRERILDSYMDSLDVDDIRTRLEEHYYDSSWEFSSALTEDDVAEVVRDALSSDDVYKRARNILEGRE